VNPALRLQPGRVTSGAGSSGAIHTESEVGASILEILGRDGSVPRDAGAVRVIGCWISLGLVVGFCAGAFRDPLAEANARSTGGLVVTSM